MRIELLTAKQKGSHAHLNWHEAPADTTGYCTEQEFAHDMMCACADCTFADFGGSFVATAYNGGSISFVRCSFDGNTLYPSLDGTSVIGAANAGSLVRLEECTFSDNTPTTAPTLLVDNRECELCLFVDDTSDSLIYSDSQSPSVCTYNEGSDFDEPLPCDTSAPKTLAESTGAGFLTASDAWFLQVQQVLLSCLPSRLA